MATTVQPEVVVGVGRVGQALLSMGPSSGDLLLRRGEALPPSAPAGPILVCTHNDDLDGVLDAISKSRWQERDAGPVAQEQGPRRRQPGPRLLCRLQARPSPRSTASPTQTQRASPPPSAPGPLSPPLQNGGLTCKVLEKAAFEKQMLEKLIWISAFMLVGARHPGATVGAVEKEYRSEVSSLIAELTSAAAAERGLSFDDGMEERLCAYSRVVAHFPSTVKEASPTTTQSIQWSMHF